MKIEASISLRRRDEEVKVHGEPDCFQFGGVYELIKLKRLLMTRFRITTSSDRMSPWVMWLRWSSCLGNLLRKSLVLNCPLDKGAYGSAWISVKLFDWSAEF